MEVRSGNATLATRSGGTAEPAVLLLHAGVTDQRSWQHLTPRLPGRWVSFDARGFGETTYESEAGWSAVGDALAVLDAHRLERAVVVGNSMGGRTALDLALTHPDRVTGLVLIGTAISGAPRPEIEPAAESVLAEYEAAEEAEDATRINRVEAHVWLDGALQEAGRAGEVTRALFLEMNSIPLSAPDPGERLKDAEAWDRFTDISVPTLVLVGEHDLRHIREWSQRLADEVIEGTVEVLPGVAHLPQLEGDQLTLDRIVDFVASLA